eukprot:TRINITY_DN15210_c0_g1_i1.p1 TRINITY_DN15210_c0_g1~~TRINITY_DN15210_c0_g1_i1.p1  ORF type:complete len:485 (-),score=51.49 TRINITY_DN15210_c0_g1_i1:75-1508(-)
MDVEHHQSEQIVNDYSAMDEGLDELDVDGAVAEAQATRKKSAPQLKKGGAHTKPAPSITFDPVHHLPVSSRIASEVVSTVATSPDPAIALSPELPFTKFMVNTTTDKIKAYDKQMEATGKLILAAHGITDTPDLLLTRPMGQSDILVVGRVSQPRNVLHLDGPMAYGERLKLHFEGVSSHSLFPGQVVAVRGTNPHGETLYCKQIMTHTTPATSTQSPPLEGDGFKMLVLAGPFAPHDRLEYIGFHQKLVNLVNDKKPDLLLLIGPLLDVLHPQVQTGNLGDRTMDEYLEKVILGPIVRKLPHQKIAVVPSIRDAQNIHVMLPQPSEAIKAGIRYLSNPANFQIESVRIGVLSQDVLSELDSVVNENGCTSGERTQRLISHLLQQRSYYPLLTGAAGVDVHELARLQLQRPHILITPSRMPAFATLVENDVIAINPGVMQAKTGQQMPFAMVTVVPSNVDPAARNWAQLTDVVIGLL